MKYFDLHCDTFLNLYEDKKGFDDPQIMAPPSLQSFDKYTQVAAFWSAHSKSADECYDTFLRASEYIKERRHLLPDNFSYIPAVEGGKLLGEDITRVKRIADEGVRVFTLVWAGLCPVGGAHGTDKGLTKFGRDVMYALFENGIVPDVSHASDKMFYEVAKICSEEKMPFIASHSNARKITPVSRNLTDDMISYLISSNSLIGINLCPPFLSDKGPATVDDIAQHIKYFVDSGASDILAFGCDFDGIDTTPIGIEGIKDIEKLYSLLLEKGFSKNLLDSVFYSNAERFFDRLNIKGFTNKDI